MPEQFAGYRIERVIGRGGMSVVYLAEQPTLERKVALKVLTPELAEDPRFRERFTRESRIAASLEHPNVIPIFEAGEEDGVLYIAMRYVEASDLGTLLQNEPLDQDRLLVILDQVAGALDAAHRRGLIHRDVKPANVLVAPGGPTTADHAYLSDFGLTRPAAVRTGLTDTGAFVGTVDYAAPEQLQGEELDARTDVYAFGCVLYRCLTGNVPFQKDSKVEVIYAHVTEPPPPVTSARPDLPPAIDGVIAKAMSKAKSDRFESCGEVMRAIRSALGAPRPSAAVPMSDETIVASTVPAPAAPTTPGKKSRGRIGLIAAVVIVLAAVAGGAAYLATRGDGEAKVLGPPITYVVDDLGIFWLGADEGSGTQPISDRLDVLSNGVDEWVNVSPNGSWLLISTERFGCEDWACLAVVPADLKKGEAVKAETEFAHGGFGAISSEGSLIVYTSDEGPNEQDLMVLRRARIGWMKPVLITAESTFPDNSLPAISADGTKVVFNCRARPYEYVGSAVCEVGVDGTGFRRVIGPEDGPDGTFENAVLHPDYDPDGGYVFQADWGGEDQIWRLPLSGGSLERINPTLSDDRTPCVLSDGRVISIWQGRAGRTSPYELKIMSADGVTFRHVSIGSLIDEEEIGCG